jgi:IS605 OrfB family transposase
MADAGSGGGSSPLKPKTGEKKRPREKKCKRGSNRPLPAEVDQLYAGWAAFPGDASAVPRKSRLAWKKKHTKSRFKRIVRRHPEAVGLKPKKKRAKATDKNKATSGGALEWPDFWNKTCQAMSRNIWLPFGLEEVAEDETNQTWFGVHVLRPAVAMPNQRRAAAAAIESVKLKKVRDAVKREEKKKQRKFVSSGEPKRKEHKQSAAAASVPPPLNVVKEHKKTKCKEFYFELRGAGNDGKRALLKKFIDGNRYCHNRLVAAFNALSKEERLIVDQKQLIRLAKLDCGDEFAETGEKTENGKAAKKKRPRVDDSTGEAIANPWLSHSRAAGFADLPYVVRKNCARNLLDKRKALVGKHEERVRRIIEHRGADAKVPEMDEIKFRERDPLKVAQESFYVEQFQLNRKTATTKTKATTTTKPGERDDEPVMDLSPIVGTVSNRAAFPGKGKLPRVFDSDCRIVYNRVHDRWKLVSAVAIEDRTSDARKGRIVAIDPGIRTFATCYDLGEQKIVEWGKRGGRAMHERKGTELIEWLCRKTDRLLSREAKAHADGAKAEYRKQANVVREKIRHLVDELHRKLAVWLCENYEVVILPHFGAKRIMWKGPKGVAKWHRAIGRKSCRKLAQLSHGRFREFLLHKAREYGTEVIVCNEAWTSKTCTRCGNIKRNLGPDKIYQCDTPSCKAIYDRDAGASRNIMLRYFALKCGEDGSA